MSLQVGRISSAPSRHSAALLAPHRGRGSRQAKGTMWWGLQLLFSLSLPPLPPPLMAPGRAVLDIGVMAAKALALFLFTRPNCQHYRWHLPVPHRQLFSVLPIFGLHAKTNSSCLLYHCLKKNNPKMLKSARGFCYSSPPGYFQCFPSDASIQTCWCRWIYD